MKNQRTLFLIGAILLTSQIVAFGKTYPWSLIPHGLGRPLWIFFSILFSILVLKEFFITDWKWPGWDKALLKLEEGYLSFLQSQMGLLVLVGLNIVFQVLSFIKFRALGYHFPFFSIAACLLSLPLFARNRLGTALGLNLALLVGSIIDFPITGFRSDMLVVIRQSLDFWSEGKSPYFGMIQYPWGLSGMPYFPGILFSHIPAWIVGLDLRWNQLLYRVIWMTLLYRQARFSADPRAASLLFFFALSPFINFRHDLYFESFLTLMAFWAFFPKIRFLLIPLLAFSWQWGLVFSPFLAWEEIFYGEDRSLRGLVLRTGRLGIGTAMVLGLFWLLLSPTIGAAEFLNSSFFSVLKFGSLSDANIFNGDYGFNFGSVLSGLGMATHAGWVLGLESLAVFLYYVFRRGARPELLWLCVSGLLAIVILSAAHFFQYYWTFPVFCLCLALLEPGKSAGRREAA